MSYIVHVEIWWLLLILLLLVIDFMIFRNTVFSTQKYFPG